jgi:hypothetical protein
MRAKALVAVAAGVTLTSVLLASGGGPVSASSHREAPLISEDAVADNTDLYVFRDATDPTKVNIIANYIGLEKPDGGPNFSKFGDDVRYEINIDNNGDVATDISYQFRFRTVLANPNTFLYNTGPITAPNGAAQNVRQVYSVQRVDSSGTHVLLSDQPTPPVNVGERSTPSATYEANLATPAIGTLPGGAKVFAGQRADSFFADLGSIFDLLGLRPINSAHLISRTNSTPINGLARTNVHTIALQLPISAVSKSGAVPTTVDSKDSFIGVYASASRQRVKVLSVAGGAPRNAGRWVQVSRLGIPLVNEVLIPLGSKDVWNATDPEDDAQFFGSILDPEPTRLLPVVYPSVFNASNTPGGGATIRTDLVQLLTGQLAGLSAANALPPADLLRVNLARAPVAGTSGNRLAALQGDAGGFPNGRRLTDDVVDIELQVLAGVLLSGFGGGNPATNIPGTSVPYSAIADGVNAATSAPLSAFPYEPTPFGGYSQPEPGVAPPVAP